jgi:DNA modification methylase
VPEVTEATCKLGDLWILGNHRLLCGDSTDKEQVEKLMDGEKADMLHTDPPYGIDYEGGSKKREKIENDAVDIFPFYKDVFANAHLATKDGASAYIWHASTETHNAINAFIASGWQYKSYIVWNKNNSTFGRSDFHWKHEPCIYGWKQKFTHTWYGDRKQTTVWDIDRPSRSDSHPTMKPIELCERPISFSSKMGDIILDLFLGSGSTLIACEKTNRKCYGMELDEHYCDVIIKRWEDYTGESAVLDA